MATRKYIVREGFVLILALPKPDGSGGTLERRYEGGETLSLDDDQYAQHAHKVELADAKDRAAALAAEQQAAATQAVAGGANNELVQAFMQALTKMAAAGQAAA